MSPFTSSKQKAAATNYFLPQIVLFIFFVHKVFFLSVFLCFFFFFNSTSLALSKSSCLKLFLFNKVFLVFFPQKWFGLLLMMSKKQKVCSVVLSFFFVVVHRMFWQKNKKNQICFKYRNVRLRKHIWTNLVVTIPCKQSIQNIYYYLMKSSPEFYQIF